MAISFVDEYKLYRYNGCGDTKAFGLVAARIALSGTHADLKAVHDLYIDDLINDSQNSINQLEGMNYERITNAVSAV
ncbi:hypothetical protein JUJ52_08665 [Virgibacillus sp. AGTR]|uniref:hypothetical protein n=1 Tax=Virgibacillus sp. AGTR TaxID=2812055 RepID=UPI001962AC00|nr:hypothetical protein [Virgibacillus sp. AGTR]MCC2250037.1 hypothetical protein [Virgibacillus sp. AGTR]QRZ17590.1 hypothetical protein JUJ52_17765 [Virgibacillus sp. AGTR]QRZ17786.1 hypothetical protein JUJ52_18920 [Virgibacillus sp. AGTR]